MRAYKKPKIFYQDKLCIEKQITFQGKEHLVIYDNLLLEIPEFKNWLTMFNNSYGVTGGESLKNLKVFPDHFDQINKLIPNASRSSLKVIAVGGGSIGDFAGFFASIFKRGVSLNHIPSTWLSAIDSAHGGKNALNSSIAKNQVGTFYFPENIIICRNLLSHLPDDQVLSGYGEVLKTALLSGEYIWSQLPNKGSINLDQLWSLLPNLIDYKYKVVSEDPFEESDIRRTLNLGHSLGHILEKHFEFHHGKAVAQGLHFTIDWSLEKKYLSCKVHEKIKNYLQLFFPCQKGYFSKHLDKKQALGLLLADKKLDIDDEINFVFLKDIGNPFVEKIKVLDVIEQLYQQSWVS